VQLADLDPADLALFDRAVRYWPRPTTRSGIRSPPPCWVPPAPSTSDCTWARGGSTCAPSRPRWPAPVSPGGTDHHGGRGMPEHGRDRGGDNRAGCAGSYWARTARTDGAGGRPRHVRKARLAELMPLPWLRSEEIGWTVAAPSAAPSVGEPSVGSAVEADHRCLCAHQDLERAVRSTPADGADLGPPDGGFADFRAWASRWRLGGRPPPASTGIDASTGGHGAA